MVLINLHTFYLFIYAKFEAFLSSQVTLCALCCFLTLCIQIVLLHNNNNNNNNNHNNDNNNNNNNNTNNNNNNNKIK